MTADIFKIVSHNTSMTPREFAIVMFVAAQLLKYKGETEVGAEHAELWLRRANRLADGIFKEHK